MALSTQEQVAEVVRLRDDDNLSFEQIGEKLGFSRDTARRRYQAALLHKAADGLVDEELDEFPNTEPLDITIDSDFIPENKGEIERFKPLTRCGDAMVICDLHIPLHDPVLINTMINCAKEEGLNKLIIAGDYFNMETFSSYLPYQPEASLEIERHDGNVIMKTLCRTFNEIDFIWGNHDFRLSRKLGFKKSFEECMRWMLEGLTAQEMAQIRFSELDYMMYYPEAGPVTLLSGEAMGRTYRICHPRNFSSVPLTVGRKLAQKFNCSIITAHSHHHAIGAAPNGYDICIEGGGFYDKYRTEYIQKSTTHHEWVQGFTFFKSGVPTLVSPILGNAQAYNKEVK